jgi:hypothetical protein
MMFIETAIKNIALEGILIYANSESIQVMYDKVVSGYHNAPSSATAEQKKKMQQNKLNLQNSIQSILPVHIVKTILKSHISIIMLDTPMSLYGHYSKS